MSWSWNACPQECHRSLSREPVVLTHHCRKSGMCMQEEMVEDMYPYKKANLPGCAMNEFTKPMENLYPMVIPNLENLDQEQRENCNHGQSSKRDINGPGPYKKLTRFKIAILKQGCFEDRLMELSIVLSYRRLDKCQFLCHRMKDSFFRKGVIHLHSSTELVQSLKESQHHLQKNKRQ